METLWLGVTQGIRYIRPLPFLLGTSKNKIRSVQAIELEQNSNIISEPY